MSAHDLDRCRAHAARLIPPGFDGKLCWPLYAALALVLGLARPAALAAQGCGMDSLMGSEYCVEVTPKGDPRTHAGNTSGLTATFTVRNGGWYQDDYVYTVSCIGPVTCGGTPRGTTVDPLQTVEVTVTYSTGGSGGTGSVRLIATGLNGNVSDEGWYNITVTPPPAAPSITPKGATTDVRIANTGGYSASFTLTNTGGSTGTFNLSCATSGPNVSCSGVSPFSLSLAPGTSQTVTAFYSVGTPGPGTLRVQAQTGDLLDEGWYNVPVEAYAVSVAPSNGTAPTRTAHTGGHSETFTITNLGSSSNTFSFSCSGSGGVSCAAAPSPVTLAAGAQTTVNQGYSVGAPGSGTLTLTATGTNTSGSGSYTVPIVSYGVSVTPDNGTAPARAANTGGHSETFTVVNTGSGTNTFSFSCGGSGGVSCAAAPSPVTLNAGQQTFVTQGYSVGAAGTGTLTLTATGTNASDAGSYSVPIVSYGVSVTPDNGTAPSRAANTGGHAEPFLVTNTGSPNTFSFTCSGSGGVVCGSAPGAVTLGAGAQATVSQSYSVGEPGTGTLTLTATGTNATDNGSYSVSIIATTLSSVVNGSFVMSGDFLVQETANSYDAYGRIMQLADARGAITDYQYGGNVTSAFLVKVIRRKNATGTIDLVTDLAWDSAGNVASIRDEGGTYRYFTHDGWGRLTHIRRASGDTLKAFAYTYSRTSANNWTFDPAAPNAVIDRTFVSVSPSVSLVSTSYFDGLGRPIQTVQQDGSSSTHYVTAQQYDAMGREWRTWKPYARTTPGYDASFATNATSFYNTYLSVSNAKPYTETQYTADALARPKKIIPEYTGSTATAFTTYIYRVDAAAKQSWTEVTDETGRKKRSYTDAFGHEVKTILGFGAPEATTTLLGYNVLGQRVQATDPRGIVTGYTLNTRGLLMQRTNPDAGNRSMKYDAAGNLRYVQDANQAAAGQVHFTTYDFAGRPLVSGLGAATFSSLDPLASASFEGVQDDWLVVHKYDGKPSNIYPWSLFWTQISPRTLTNVAGRLAAVASRSNGVWQVDLFRYDTDGNVDIRYTYTQGSDGTVLTALNTTLDYRRDLRGELTRRKLTVGSSNFYQFYDYDGRGLLWKVSAGTTSTKPSTPDATYIYRPGGQLQSRQYKSGPLVPMRYTIREQLERIGDPAVTTYPFSARYAYHANGTVQEAEFYSAGSPASQKRYRYVFGASSYDALNRLKSADFSSWSGSGWTTTAAHDLTGINYDAAGNLTALGRYRETGTLVDNLTYSYPGSSNRLGSTTDAVSGNPETWDAKSGSFTYDANGNLKTAPAPYAITAATYDVRNLPLSLTSGGVTTTYRYNGEGQRITKQVAGGNTELYVLEGATTLGVFTVNGSGSLVSSYFNLHAGDRVIGRQVVGGSRLYYHKDLLGSTRAVVQGTTVVESYDYDPWGLLMPGRSLAGATKERFTGKERDAETGLDYFGFRYYMAALGRWTTVDPPADDFPSWSPYNYVENNPIAVIDPFGLSAVSCTAEERLCPEETPESTQARHQNNPASSSTCPDGQLQVNGECRVVRTGPGMLEAVGPPLVRAATIARFARVLSRTRSLSAAFGAARVSGQTTLEMAKQGRHIVGHSSYRQGRSILSHMNPQGLLDEFAGTGQRVRGVAGEAGHVERINFGQVIGQYVDPATGEAVETTVGLIHYSRNGAHIVPGRPMLP